MHTQANVIKLGAMTKRSIRSVVQRLLSWIGAILIPISFIIFTAGVILYSKGYRFVNNTIVQTGSITIKSNVRGSEMWLNDKQIGVTSSKVLTGLEIGDYMVEVRKDNYYSYKCPVSVREGLSYSIFSKLFRRKDFVETETLLGATTTQYFSNSEKNTILAYTEFSDYFIVTKCTVSYVIWSSTSCSEIFNSKETGFNSIDFSTLKLIPAPDNSKVLVQFDVKPEVSLDETVDPVVNIESKNLIIYTTNSANSYLEASNIPTGALISGWSDNGEYLILRRDNEIIAQDFKKALNIIVLSSNHLEDIIYTFVNGSILYVNEEGIVSKSLSGTETELIVPTDTRFLYQALPTEEESADVGLIFNPTDVSELYSDSTGTLFVVKIGTSYWYLDTVKLTAHEIVNCYESDCQLTSISPDANKVLVNVSDVYFNFWLNVEEWDYITTYDGYEIADCSETECNLVWGDDSSVIFFWKEGTIWYSDLWGINRNQLFDDIISSFVALNDSGELIVGKPSPEGTSIELLRVIVR